jgi:hypothetical protein
MESRESLLRAGTLEIDHIKRSARRAGDRLNCYPRNSTSFRLVPMSARSPVDPDEANAKRASSYCNSGSMLFCLYASKKVVSVSNGSKLSR